MVKTEDGQLVGSVVSLVCHLILSLLTVAPAVRFLMFELSCTQISSGCRLSWLS